VRFTKTNEQFLLIISFSQVARFKLELAPERDIKSKTKAGSHMLEKRGFSGQE
jgi:hypothetical protein